MNENRTARYLKYAIGEIILVVIGILIALQINNWNEKVKDYEKQNIILKAVKQDFENDLFSLAVIKERYLQQLTSFKTLSPNFDVGDRELPKPNDSLIIFHDTNYKDYFYRPPSFQLSTGSYQTLLNYSEGIATRNPELFSLIQEIHLKISEHLNSIYETIKTAENQVNWKWNQSIRRAEFNEAVISEDMLNDLSFFHEHILLYYQILNNAERYFERAIATIENEISDNK